MREARALLCKDPRLATDPFDVLLGRGWIDSSAHQAGRTFGALCRAAGRFERGLSAEGAVPMARLEAGRSDPQAPGAAAPGRLSQLNDAEIGKAWDAVFGEDRQGDRDQRALGAEKALARFAEPLSSAERRMLFALCAAGEWPAWLFRLIEAERTGAVFVAFAQAGEAAREAGHGGRAWPRELLAVRSALDRLLRRT